MPVWKRLGTRWASRTSNPVSGSRQARGGFDSHTLPPTAPPSAFPLDLPVAGRSIVAQALEGGRRGDGFQTQHRPTRQGERRGGKDDPLLRTDRRVAGPEPRDVGVSALRSVRRGAAPVHPSGALPGAAASTAQDADEHP